MKHIEKLKDYDVDVSEDFRILKELEESHRAIHESEQASRYKFIKTVNTEVMMPGSSESDFGSGISSMEEEIKREKDRFKFQTTRYPGEPKKITEVSEGSEADLSLSDRFRARAVGLSK